MIDHAAILVQKLASMFPNSEERDRIRDELNKYGQEPYEGAISRVQLAILKVAGTSFEKIREWTDIAKRDFRDVLAAAEYPEELITPTWKLPQSECKAIREKDAEQYLRWIEEKYEG